MSPERIYDALANGAMKLVAVDKLTDDQRKRVAESIAGRPLGTETAVLGGGQSGNVLLSFGVD
jgi:hypothetical protein